jgi:hypothetical protein
MRPAQILRKKRPCLGTVALLAAIAAILCHLPPLLAVAFALAVYLCRNGKFDELCGCK